MKKNSLIALLFAALTMCIVSCQKDKTVDVEVPSFNNLYSYIGMDAETVSASLQAKGFTISHPEGTKHIKAQKGDVSDGDDYAETYSFYINNRSVVLSSEYKLKADASKIAKVSGNSPISGNVKDLLANEKELRPQSDMQYLGYIVTGDSVAYNDKDQFISAVNDLKFKKLGRAKSISTYNDINTEIRFSFDYFAIEVQKRRESQD